jgi:hypothetical protein
MSFKKRFRFTLPVLLGILLFATSALSGGGNSPNPTLKPCPHPLDSYNDAGHDRIFSILLNRAQLEPFNVVATLIFFLAILHTFLTSYFMKLSHQWEKEHEKKILSGKYNKYSVSHKAELFHFLGEVEAVFGIWAAALVVAIIIFFDWPTAVHYIQNDVNFTEAMFVVVIMTLAATRPILKLAESVMWRLANILGGTITAWWFTILTMGPILGAFITEPAAMTISALLLSTKFYDLEPDNTFKYATAGLLFVNISVGGTLTHFAAPPVLMVACPWSWGMDHMIFNFGWKAIIGILLANGIYYLYFRGELNKLQKQFSILVLKDEIQKKYLRQKDLEAEFDKIGCLLGDRLGFAMEFEAKTKQIKDKIGNVIMNRHQESFLKEGIDPNLIKEAYEQRFDEIRRRKMRMTIPGIMPEHERPIIMDPEWDSRDDEVPVWVMIIHILFMVWTIFNAHHPAIFVPGLLFFLGFAQVTAPFQNKIDLKPALLVGFFLGGLVIHGGLQGWWIAPVLERLGEIPLMFSATLLSAFNDNAAITFLSTLVPGFTDGMKYSVVAGAVAGGGLTVIANAPNPAGQSILKKYFEDGISPLGLLMGAALPTSIMLICFLLLR